MIPPDASVGGDYQAPQSDELAQIPREAARIAARGATATEEQVEALRAYLDVRALAFLSRGGDPPLSMSGYPGYFEVDAGYTRVLVPFHLAPVFPTSDILAEVVSVAERVALSADNPICISGSTTFLQVIPHINDLDYCEYYLGDVSGIPADVEAKLAGDGRDFSLVEVKCGGKLHPPWPGIPPWFREQFAGVASATSPSIKLDFLTNTKLGLLPTTSLILPVEPGQEGGNADRSFAYQEAVICRGDPPRALDRPESMGRYVNWLLEDARRWLERAEDTPIAKRAPKALKRLLSLALLLGEAELVEEVVEGLRQPALGDVSLAARVAEVTTMLQHLTDDHGRHHNAKIEADRSSRRFSDEDVQAVLRVLLELGQDILAELDLLLRDAEFVNDSG